jgi:pre-mRNA cleavage complex 2 protein Pcf11
LETLKADLAKLISNTKIAWELNPSDLAIAPKLKALMDLQTVLNTQTIPPQQLQAIRERIQALSPQPAPVQTFPSPLSLPPQPFINPSQQLATPAFPTAGSPLDLAQILANARLPIPQASTPANPTQSLADLLRRVSTPTQTSSTPTAMSSHYPPPSLPVAPQPIAPTPAPAPVPTPTPTNNLAELLASLNKPVATTAQVAPPQPSLSQLFPQRPAAAPASTPDWLSNALKGLPQLAAVASLPQSTPTASTAMTRQTSSTMNAPGNVDLATASMKQ